MTDLTNTCVERRNSTTSRQSSIPIRSIHLRSSGTLDSSCITNRPSTSSCVKTRWKIDKLPARYSDVPLNPPTPESDWRLQSEPSWTRVPTEEPLSPRLRAEVKEDLMESWYFSIMDEYRRTLKACWFEESFYLTIKSPVAQLEPRLLGQLCNKLTSFYWMPSTKFDGIALPLLPFGCIFSEWLKYHDDQPDIESGDFFAHLVRVYPTGPNTVQAIAEAHRTICNEAVLLLERVDHGEANGCLPNGRNHSRRYNLKPTYRAIVVIMDQYIDPRQGKDPRMLINLEEHSKNQTVLLVRTRDETHLSAPINFESLKANGLCLPLDENDVLATSGDVVRVSLANAVKFIADLQQREDVTSLQPRAPLETNEVANEWADELLKEADEQGFDNVSTTWSAVRRVKATRKGETFEEREPYPFNRYWR